MKLTSQSIGRIIFNPMMIINISTEIIKRLVRLTLISSYLLLTICINGCKSEADIPDDRIWLDQNSLDISSADITSNDIDFSSIDRSIGNATIVGLGEATHGTAEFWGIRQKLTKHLIEKKDFKAVLLEAPYPNMLYVDNYVVNHEGTIEEAHTKINVWKYKEMRDMIEMIYNHNSLYPENKVHFLGYDCAFAKWGRASEIVLAYLDKTDPAGSSVLRSSFNIMNMENAEFILDFITLKRKSYIAVSGINEYLRIWLVANNLQASVIHMNLLNSGANAIGYRDEFNINNVQFIQDSLLNGGKIIIWAHNAHIGKGMFPCSEDVPSGPLLGYRLNQKYGNYYYNICTELFRGRFWSWDECDGHEYSFQLFDVTAPTSKYYVHYFNKSGKQNLFMDFNSVDIMDPRAEWLRNENKIHVYGGTFCPALDTGNYYAATISLVEYFNGIFFFRDTNPTTYLSDQ
jgi:erythromycin esterase-like protein